MSFESLPIEMVTQIIECFDESDPEKAFEFGKHREMCKTLKALRLTCKALGRIAIPKLFCTFCFIPTLKSWLNLCRIAAFQDIGMHVQTLALERHHSGTHNFKGKMRTASSSPHCCHLDLSLFPKLKTLKAEDKWFVTKQPRSEVQIPRGRCKIQAISFSDCKPAIWRVLGDIAEITRYGFTITSVNCYLGNSGPWQTLLSLDLSGLKYLKLSSDGFYSNRYRCNLRPDIELLVKLRRLPNLEEFHLNQYFFGHDDPNTTTTNFTTNVLKYLLAKDWPRLHYLDLRYLTTTVADFQSFVAPHAGMLGTFHLHSGLVCPRATEDEKLQRYYLPHWIRTVVCPRGGGTRFEHFLGQAEGFFEGPEDYDNDAEEEDAVTGNAEDGDILMEDLDDDAELDYFEEDFEGDITMVNA